MQLLRLLLIALPIAACAGCSQAPTPGANSDPQTHPTSSTTFSPMASHP